MPRKLPIFERYAEDGRLMGYQVKIRRRGFPSVTKQFGDASMTTAQARTMAEEFAISVLGKMNDGSFIDRKEIEATTLSDALDRYEREVSAKKKTADKEKGLIARLKKRDLASRPIAKLFPKDFAKFRDARLADGLAANSVRLELALLRHLWTIGIKEWGWPVSNPVALIRSPKPAKGRERRLSRELSRPPDDDKAEPKDEEGRLLDACEASKSQYLAPIVRLALATGMRQGEILDLLWENVDLEKKVALLPDTKNGTSRRVPLSSVAVAVFKGLLPGGGEAENVTPIKRPAGLVFPIGQMGIVHAFARACSNAGIEGLHFHDLRHEATSRFFEKGFGIQEVAALTGHKTLQMLKRYTHLRAEDLAEKLG